MSKRRRKHIPACKAKAVAEFAEELLWPMTRLGPWSAMQLRRQLEHRAPCILSYLLEDFGSSASREWETIGVTLACQQLAGAVGSRSNPGQWLTHPIAKPPFPRQGLGNSLSWVQSKCRPITLPPRTWCGKSSILSGMVGLT